jgi:hypothetical protein
MAVHQYTLQKKIIIDTFLSSKDEPPEEDWDQAQDMIELAELRGNSLSSSR